MLRALLSILLMSLSVIGFSGDFEAGKDYEVIKTANQPDKAAKPVQVTEFFSYGCPWCGRLEPALNQWISLQKNKITFNKIPVVFNNDWQYYAKAFYTAKALSLQTKMNPLFFKAILDDKKSLNNTDAMINFFITNGVDKIIAESAFRHSPSIDLDITQGQVLMGQYHVTAVPSIIINGQYKTDLQMAKTEERLFAILDFLVAKSK